MMGHSMRRRWPKLRTRRHRQAQERAMQFDENRPDNAPDRDWVVLVVWVVFVAQFVWPEWSKLFKFFELFSSSLMLVVLPNFTSPAAHLSCAATSATTCGSRQRRDEKWASGFVERQLGRTTARSKESASRRKMNTHHMKKKKHSRLKSHTSTPERWRTHCQAQ